MTIPLNAESLVADMARAFPRFPRVTIERLVRRTSLKYEALPVQAFVAILVRREVAACLSYVDSLDPSPPAVPEMTTGYSVALALRGRGPGAGATATGGLQV